MNEDKPRGGERMPRTIQELLGSNATVAQLNQYIDNQVQRHPLFKEMEQRLEKLESGYSDDETEKSLAEFMDANTGESTLAGDLKSLTVLFVKSGLNFRRAFEEAKQFMGAVR
jgi:hypothetical protein